MSSLWILFDVCIYYLDYLDIDSSYRHIELLKPEKPTPIL